MTKLILLYDAQSKDAINSVFFIFSTYVTLLYRINNNIKT